MTGHAPLRQSSAPTGSGPNVYKPTPLTPEQKKTRVLAELRQATWEASQHVALTDIERFVAGCLDEIRSDEP